MNRQRDVIRVRFDHDKDPNIMPMLPDEGILSSLGKG